MTAVLIRIQPDIVANAGGLGVEAAVPGGIILVGFQVGGGRLAGGVDVGIGRVVATLINWAGGVASWRHHFDVVIAGGQIGEAVAAVSQRGGGCNEVIAAIVQVDSDVVEAAIIALGQIGGEEPTRILTELLEDPEAESFYEAIEESLEEMSWLSGDFELFAFDDSDDADDEDDLGLFSQN